MSLHSYFLWLDFNLGFKLEQEHILPSYLRNKDTLVFIFL